MAENSDSTSFRDFLDVIFRHKGKILTLFLGTVTTVALGSFLMKPTYETNSKILIKFGRENIYIPATANGSNPIVSFNRQEEINSEIEILRSRNLVEKTVKAMRVEAIYPELLTKTKREKGKLTPFDKAVIAVEKKLDIEGIARSDIINVRFQHHDPHTAANLVNTLVNLYLDHHLNVHKNRGGYAFFKEQVAVAEARLKKSEQALEGFKNRHNISSLDYQKTLILGQLSELQAALKKTRRQIHETQSMIAEIKRQLVGNPEEITIGMEMDRNPQVIASLKEKLIELRSIEQQLLTRYKEESRTVQNKRMEIAEVKKALAKEELKVYEADVNALRIREVSQRNHLTEYERELEKLNNLEMELRRLERQRDTDERNYKLYLTRLEESRISNTMDLEKIANVSVVEPALVPLKPVKPKKLLNIALSVFLGTVGGLGLAFFSDFIDHSLRSKADFEEKLEIPLLVSIPDFKPTH